MRTAVSSWSLDDRLGHWRVRFGVRRKSFRVEPGLYALGSPGADSPVLASANYRLSFDHLRRALAGRDAWILVLDTHGINVWCAAGKGTFGSGEMVARIASVGLAARVRHRTIVVPQLGATGIAAREVSRDSGFDVVFGPVRAADLPAFLDAGMAATPRMRRVTFTFADRLVLVPVELVQSAGWVAPLLGILLLAGGLVPGGFSWEALVARAPATAAACAGALLAGSALTPLLLPWIPGRAFALKGALLGALWAAVAAPLLLRGEHAAALGGWAALLTVASAFCAMQFTGSSVITSLSGVRREMRIALPLEIAGAAIGLVLVAAGRYLGMGG
ncbi:MAG TPA: mercury methylation corrinoid protein HgcA [bacterium]